MNILNNDSLLGTLFYAYISVRICSRLNVDKIGFIGISWVNFENKVHFYANINIMYITLVNNVFFLHVAKSTLKNSVEGRRSSGGGRRPAAAGLTITGARTRLIWVGMLSSDLNH